jgi:hypothetical protein
VFEKVCGSGSALLLEHRKGVMKKINTFNSDPVPVKYPAGFL